MWVRLNFSPLYTDIVKTAPDRPQSFPKNISAGGGKEGTLVISWIPLPKEEWNAPTVRYYAQYKEAVPGETSGDVEDSSWNVSGAPYPVPSAANPSHVLMVLVSALL